ncbi:hypothetical protein EJ07DRAFT_128981, partial [Lizonia empirigonia]
QGRHSGLLQYYGLYNSGICLKLAHSFANTLKLELSRDYVGRVRSQMLCALLMLQTLFMET